MEGFLYDIEKSIDFFQEEDYFSTGDRSILKEELNISLFETNNDKEEKKINLGEKKKKINELIIVLKKRKEIKEGKKNFWLNLKKKKKFKEKKMQ